MENKQVLLLFIIAVFTLGSSCTHNQTPQQSDKSDSSAYTNTNTGDAAQSDTIQMCFLKTTGTSHQDSAYVYLHIYQHTVNGTYEDIPYEKDARKGRVEGSKTADILDLRWTFMQEGMEDTLRVVFKLKDQQLLQKPLSADPATGRQITRDSSAFSIVYDKIPCQ